MGTEIAKNVLLSGISSLTVYDESTVVKADLGANFYLRSKDIGSTRGKACSKRLKKLNSAVEVKMLTSQTFKGDNKILEYFANIILEREEENPENSTMFDFVIISTIDVFFTLVEAVRHHLLEQNKDLGKYGDVKTGNHIHKMGELNSLFTFNRSCRNSGIKLIIGESFGVFCYSFNDFGPNYQTNNMEVQFQSLEEEIFIKQEKDQAYNNERDFTSFKPNYQDNDEQRRSLLLIHAYFRYRAVVPGYFCTNQGEYDKIEKDIVAFLQKDSRVNEKDLLVLAKWVSAIAYFSRVQLAPVVCYMGGIIAYEIIKVSTGNVPFWPWMFSPRPDLLSILRETSLNELGSNDSNQNSEDIIVLKEEVQRKIGAFNVFLPGVGAIGCEIIKNFSLLGLCSSKEGGCLWMTDFDDIDQTNLNRQILFSYNDIGKNKALTASKIMTKIGFDMQTKAFDKKLCALR